MVFKNKKDRFAHLLHKISLNINEAGKYFSEFNAETQDDLRKLAEVMKEYELKGDTLVHKIILELNNAFITPIEREDMLELTNRLDDILDGFEQASFILEMYNISTKDEYITKFLENLSKATADISIATGYIFDKKLKNVRELAIQIKDYESICDDIYRDSIRHLNDNITDPITFFKYREAYEDLEDIADGCQSVANTLETIVMKNA
ncbi:DUF47 domain-containing protein [Brochothrix thermosphacta]|uniref:DUF47 domain-containing protein n=1 Tax=Brochothrix thermosphacta TaxID=2756 RepID=A0A1D2LPW5_BROTH|nr:DUF47 domain-containing protein [Brochothrix thermosphacta]ATF25517.1 DUF47 domain-containing protein [Brochothrix thermosphacta]ATH84850.1 DUF47 domain-containing protein [Brochothrix thermosphacta]ODJ64199.1 hypothetical protein BFR36_03085 [Brochothrix thermosphacta]ODJ71930.1 hypothetical protein BFR39_04095 [Brochothrix thermosphacta]ODJ73899.1 hypothetical protein BFR45_08275 [Brochothrix thermosphacta]